MGSADGLFPGTGGTLSIRKERTTQEKVGKGLEQHSIKKKHKKTFILIVEETEENNSFPSSICQRFWPPPRRRQESGRSRASWGDRRKMKPSGAFHGGATGGDFYTQRLIWLLPGSGRAGGLVREAETG